MMLYMGVMSSEIDIILDRGAVGISGQYIII